MESRVMVESSAITTGAADLAAGVATGLLLTAMEDVFGVVADVDVADAEEGVAVAVEEEEGAGRFLLINRMGVTVEEDWAASAPPAG